VILTVQNRLQFLTIKRYLIKILRIYQHLTVTVQYPFVIKPIPSQARLKIKNNFSECTGCMKCEELCPTKAIEIQGELLSASMRPLMTVSGNPVVKTTDSFKIKYDQCISCGICVQVCPTQSLSFEKVTFSPQYSPLDLSVDLVRLPRSMRRGVQK
jgi:formate hydrogenlyase subunit 6/NADH:ubiquinone oxidoreductase subunit I